jgi:hypothetical protein
MPRELSVLYYDSDASPCACFADGIAIATYASVGQRTLIISPQKAPAGDAAVIIIRPRHGGPGFKYAIPVATLVKLGPMNKDLDPRGRYDAVMAIDGCLRFSLRGDAQPFATRCESRYYELGKSLAALLTATRIGNHSGGFRGSFVAKRTDRLVWGVVDVNVSEINAMPIQPLLLGSGAFSPEEVVVLTAAFEDALRALSLVDRKDPAVTMVAKRVIELAKGGEHDPILLRDAVLKSLRDAPKSQA